MDNVFRPWCADQCMHMRARCVISSCIDVPLLQCNSIDMNETVAQADRHGTVTPTLSQSFAGSPVPCVTLGDGKHFPASGHLSLNQVT